MFTSRLLWRPGLKQWRSWCMNNQVALTANLTLDELLSNAMHAAAAANLMLTCSPRCCWWPWWGWRPDSRRQHRRWQWQSHGTAPLVAARRRTPSAGPLSGSCPCREWWKKYQAPWHPLKNKITMHIYSNFWVWLPFLSRPSLKITERSYSATTLMQVQSEKGSVTITRSKANPVSTMAQNPGPSGSAANKKNLDKSYDPFVNPKGCHSNSLPSSKKRREKWRPCRRRGSPTPPPPLKWCHHSSLFYDFLVFGPCVKQLMIKVDFVHS